MPSPFLYTLLLYKVLCTTSKTYGSYSIASKTIPTTYFFQKRSRRGERPFLVKKKVKTSFCHDFDDLHEKGCFSHERMRVSVGPLSVNHQMSGRKTLLFLQDVFFFNFVDLIYGSLILIF